MKRDFTGAAIVLFGADEFFVRRQLQKFNVQATQ